MTESGSAWSVWCPRPERSSGTSSMVRILLPRRRVLTLDSQVRSELETRLTHLQPAELLLPEAGLSKATEKVLRHFTGDPR